VFATVGNEALDRELHGVGQWKVTGAGVFVAAKRALRNTDALAERGQGEAGALEECARELGIGVALFRVGSHEGIVT
jgi:hypothetical protein